jgi:hypothetical protein
MDTTDRFQSHRVVKKIFGEKYIAYATASQDVGDVGLSRSTSHVWRNAGVWFLAASLHRRSNSGSLDEDGRNVS